MPAKRRYNVKGTNDFLVLAGIFFFLCLWAVKDAWYPSDKVIKKHPRAAAIAFESDGTVEAIHVSAGDQVNENQVVAVLRADRINVKYEAAKTEYAAAKKEFNQMELAYNRAKNDGASEGVIAEQLEHMETARSKMDGFKERVDELYASLDATELIVPEKGKVTEIKIHPHKLVKAGEAAMTFEPSHSTHFFVFNKSLAIFSFIAFWVFLAIHILAR